MKERWKGGGLESVVGEEQPKHRHGDESKCVYEETTASMALCCGFAYVRTHTYHTISLSHTYVI